MESQDQESLQCLLALSHQALLLLGEAGSFGGGWVLLQGLMLGNKTAGGSPVPHEHLLHQVSPLGRRGPPLGWKALTERQ